jgi:hypothetical protein
MHAEITVQELESYIEANDAAAWAIIQRTRLDAVRK